MSVSLLVRGLLRVGPGLRGTNSPGPALPGPAVRVMQGGLRREAGLTLGHEAQRLEQFMQGG